VGSLAACEGLGRAGQTFLFQSPRVGFIGAREHIRAQSGLDLRRSVPGDKSVCVTVAPVVTAKAWATLESAEFRLPPATWFTDSARHRLQWRLRARGRAA
jgi:hypothetical protein